MSDIKTWVCGICKTEWKGDEESDCPACSSLAPAQCYAAALEYATRLAKGMWERDWQEESPNWKPLDDLMGVLSQIDNMLAGMEKKKRHNKDIMPH